ncbi:MAG: YbjQ family protein [Xanthomonadaceae bacterium]|jgi:uncharacterized protein YbjQ (UPF0145 family)|nr:YbjQ family protein [Xanthomonadaceae bacterium]
MSTLILFLLFFVAPMLVTFVIGQHIDRKHQESIRKREIKYCNVIVTTQKAPPPSYSGQSFRLVAGAVVIGSNHFRQVIASLQSFIGGRISSFEPILERGRQEAILRMKETAYKRGDNFIANVRFETVPLSGNASRYQYGMGKIELLAYGTAWRAPQSLPDTTR